MGSGWRMCKIQLWLLAFLVFSSLTSLADCSLLQVMSAPNLLRVGTAENIFVECQDCTGGDIKVDIQVVIHPTKIRRLASTSVILTNANNFQALAQITIPASSFNKDPNMKQYVYLQAQFPDRLLEKVVLVSFKSGHIFIQTDKTIYTPKSNVLYRMFAVMPDMKPAERNAQTLSDDLAQIDIEIETPEGIIFPTDTVSLRSGIYSGEYRLDEIVSLGVWKVVAKFHNYPQQSFSAEFKVKEYVLPSFEVKLLSLTQFFYVDSEELTINIKATYLFGAAVDGTAYVVFGVMHGGQKRSFPSSLQQVQIEGGNGEVRLRREHIIQSYSNIHDLVGNSIYATVSVLTQSGGEMVEEELRGIQIVTSPYTINFKKTPKYFQPGMAFYVTVEVLNPDDTPAQHVAVLFDPGQLMGMTADNGMARLAVNTQPGADQLTVTARTNDPRISRERQASATMVAHQYTTNNNNFIHLGADTSEVRLGDNLKVNIFTNRPTQSDITYLETEFLHLCILSRGGLVKNGRYKTRGQVMISMIFHITQDMLPSFRIVAYYHTNDNEVVSDSLRVDVKDSCMGTLRLEPLRSSLSYDPRKIFGLKITGDPGATVGLVTVDKGVYGLNNKHRLTQKKVWNIVEKSDTGCTPGGGKDAMSVFYDAGLLFESSISGTPYRTDSLCPTRSRKKRAEEEDSYLDSDDIVSRTAFAESWLWSEVQLPSCLRPNCDTTSLVKKTPLGDSVTTWQIIGISLSRTHGICVADPLEFIVRKEFFIDLKLPYSAVRGEQLEIKAILHNYTPDPMTVRVDLIEEADMCSSAYKRGKYRQEVNIDFQSTRSVPFIIIPMRAGQHSIEVKAAVKDSYLSDAVRKSLWVAPQGILVKSTTSVVLDPANKAVDGKQEETVNSSIPMKNLVPGSPMVTQIFVTGREQISAQVENMISGRSMGSLISQPRGDGEANMIQMTLPVIATMYLDKTNQWETVGLGKRNEALQHTKVGYLNELAFRKSDGSFAVWANRPGVTWLTAYVAKVFKMAHNLVPVENTVICDAIKFLILKTQQPDGMFREVGTVIHREMMGDVQGTDSDASMTAFCLSAMQESRALCAATVNSLPVSIEKAVAYLETRLPSLTNPYAVAMTSYALANENKLNQKVLYNFANPDLSHWPVPKGVVYTLEATAYALLALVKAEAFKEAQPVVRWFSQQQKVGGGYGSTQATIMVYQAVAEYWDSVKEQEYDLNVDILLPGKTKPNKYSFNRNNHHTTRMSKFSTINENVTVTARGNGEATVRMESLYYALPKEKESECQKFNLSVQLLPEKSGEDGETYKLKINIMYKDSQRDATMSVLDIGLLTGFTVNTNDLNLLSKGRARKIAKFEMARVLSERGSLIIYLDKVSHTRPEEISFRIHQVLRVGILQPAAVSVYEYYDETPCVKFYHPMRTNGDLLRLCTGYECRCAEVECGVQKKGKVSSDERNSKTMEVTLTSRIDFVYKVRVESFTGDLSRDIYTVRIVEVIKEGRSLHLMGRQITFFSFQECRESLDLKPGKTYLIMGGSRDISNDEQGGWGSVVAPFCSSHTDVGFKYRKTQVRPPVEAKDKPTRSPYLQFTFNLYGAHMDMLAAASLLPAPYLLCTKPSIMVQDRFKAQKQ